MSAVSFCMRHGPRVIVLLVGLLGFTAPWPFPAQVFGQPPVPPPSGLSDAIRVDEADSATRTHLERAKASIANEQWDEAIEILRQVAEGASGKVLAVSPGRFVSVRDYCHLQLALLPGEALELYRSRVDVQARRWYEEGIRRRDVGRLRHVVDQLFCSSSGDDALLALGDLELEAGNPGEARGYWEKILPPDDWATLAPPVVQTNGSPVWLLYPDSDIDRAAVRARLVLAAILEGDAETSRMLLDDFVRDCGGAEGKLGGRTVNYAEFLNKLLSESQQWPAEKVDRDWPTFAGTSERSKVFPTPVEIGSLAWEASLPEVSLPDASSTVTGTRRIAERRDHLLSYHPVIVGNMVLVNTADEIRAYQLSTGEPVWGDSPIVYKLPRNENDARANLRGATPATGAPRFTLTVRDRRVYARMGNPVTGRVNEQPFGARHSFVVCVDLEAEAKALWATPDTLGQDDHDASWSFEGSPVVDGDGVYVAMRRNGARPQQYVACLDPETGALKWRRLICGAETAAQGLEEMTHHLLCLHAGTLYCNTNLGAVAALSTSDGAVRWITRYPRAGQVDLSKRPKHFFRDLTPCVYDNGVLYVAPADSDSIIALDAPTGLRRRPQWQTAFAEDAIHLLGVMDGKLVASGDKLWWVDAQTGKILSPPGTAADSFPEGGSPKGLGRGLLADGKVYWPTWDRIYVFDQRNNRQLEPINLSARNAVGGNLLPAGDSLLIASHDRITVFRAEGTRQDARPQETRPSE